MAQTYQTIAQYEARFKEMHEAGFGCSDAVADQLLAERKKLHAELHAVFPEYFAQKDGRIRYAVR